MQVQIYFSIGCRQPLTEPLPIYSQKSSVFVRLVYGIVQFLSYS